MQEVLARFFGVKGFRKASAPQETSVFMELLNSRTLMSSMTPTHRDLKGPVVR